MSTGVSLSEENQGELDDPDPGGNREMKDDEWDAHTGKIPVWPPALRAMITRWLVSVSGSSITRTSSPTSRLF